MQAIGDEGMQIGGVLMLVQLLVYSRFPLICPVMRPPQLPRRQVPLLVDMLFD